MLNKRKLIFSVTAIILTAYFFILGIFKAKGFFAPLITAIILSLIVLPLATRIEKKLNRTIASLLSSLFLFTLSIGLIVLISFQIRSFGEDWPKIKETMKPKIEQLKQFALQHTPLDSGDIEQAQENSSNTSGQAASKKIADFMKALSGFFANYLLTFIYVFFLLNYRKIFKNFLIRVMPDNRRETTRKIISKSVKVAPQYLIGKLILMGMLTILYSIGLGISGVNNFIMISIIAAVLTLIPYVGNLIGFTMAVAVGFLSSGDINVLIGIALTFTITQFIESYALEPFVVGDRVDVHPFFVILAVVAGNMIWGIIGMVLAIPVLGIITVVLLNIEEFRAFGILLSKKEFSENNK